MEFDTVQDLARVHMDGDHMWELRVRAGMQLVDKLAVGRMADVKVDTLIDLSDMNIHVAVEHMIVDRAHWCGTNMALHWTSMA